MFKTFTKNRKAMNLPELNEVLRKLKSESDNKNKELIQFYEASKIKLIERIKINVLERLNNY